MLLLTAGLAPGGCRKPLPPAEAPQFVAADVIVSVTNRTSRRLGISLRAGPLSRPLGAVSAGTSQLFALPSELANSGDSLNFEAQDGQRRRAGQSAPFRLPRGGAVRWLIDGSASGRVEFN